MKILQVSCRFANPVYYRSNEFTLCRSLARLGHDVTLFASDKSPKWQMLQDRGSDKKTESIDSFTLKRFPSGPELASIPTMPTLLGEILESEWDLVHGHDVITPSSFYCALASRIKGRSFILTQHDYLFGGTHGTKLFLHMLSNRTIGRFTLGTAKAVIGLSSSAARFAQDLGVSPSNARVIPNSVDTSVFRPGSSNFLKREWGIHGRVILFVGRLSASKGLEVLLKAFGKIMPESPRANLLIIGRGPEEARLRAIRDEMKLDRVIFAGQQLWSVMRKIYPACEFLVLPSFYEPFGNVVLEAMASGLPVIGSKIAGMADVISHGETGYHITPGDSDQLARYMRVLLADRALRSEMSRAARKATEKKFDDMVVARNVERLYYECVRRGRS